MQHIKAGRQNKERTVISDLILVALFEENQLCPVFFDDQVTQLGTLSKVMAT